MFRNYFTVAVRHLNRQKGYSGINVISLALGIACCLLIVLYVRDELSFDRYHDKADRIYRVVTDERQGDQVSRTADVLLPTVTFIRDEFPEVEQSVRFVPPGNAWMLRYEGKGFYERSFYLADSSVFDVFDVPLVIGDPGKVLSGNDKIVLSESIARKYFGDENPIGKVLIAEGTFHLEVTGIMRDLPSNTHLGFDILASFRIQEAYSDRTVDEWGWRRSHSYILLEEGADPAELEAKLPAFVQKHLGSRYDNDEASLILNLQPVTDIHLHSRLENELTPNSDISYIYLFIAVAAFIILIACINYMNLATARSAGRAREIGLRKVFGAARGQVVRQFLIESLTLTGLAVCLALVIAAVSLPWFNMLTGKAMELDGSTAWFAVGAAVLFGISIGCVSGSYPALYLSGFAPIETLKGSLSTGAGNARLRRLLVIGQFVISIALIICTGIVYSQLEYIRAKNMGLKTDQVIAIPQTFEPVMNNTRSFKQRVQASPHVVSVSATYTLPGHKFPVIPLTIRKSGEDEADKIELYQAWTDADFAEVLGIELLAGRYFDQTFSSDWIGSSSTVLNEAAVTRLGYDSPDAAVGMTFDRLMEQRQGWEEEGRSQHTIIGVVRNYHYASLHEPIGPVALFPDHEGGHVLIKVDTWNLKEGLAAIQEAWQEVNPDFAFEYTFVDQTFARLYESEQRFARIFVTFAALAVSIACLGLFGLASFTAERRTREIGVRKVLGATVPNLFRLLCNEFFWLVVVANLIAWPVAYSAMSRWLDGFSYRVDLSWTIFILAGVLAMAIAQLTVSYQALRAATANPVVSLRSE